jgi:hypothetical protein
VTRPTINRLSRRSAKKMPGRVAARTRQKEFRHGLLGTVEPSRNSVISLGRPRIEAERGTGGWLTILPNGHAWLAGSRRQALREFAELERIERRDWS